MGISGLIPFLEKASSKINLKELQGNTIAVDTYCWLHKGAFACADKLARGEKTDIHIQYCLKYVNMLLSNGIKPILVFDGRHLPAKAMTENKRRENRKTAKLRAAELLRLGKVDEAKSFFRRCVDITHEMALQLIQECRRRNVDCIVAPYEADAQLAFFNLRNIAQYIITEDSDLVLFGCKKILYKLDLTGCCLMVDTDKLYLTMGCKPEKFSFDKFRFMCILSGCDYLDSLPGIGLAKACKFFLKTEDNDIKRVLSKIPAYLNMRHLDVSEEYKENFLKANATFKHMIVYDPLEKSLVYLTDPVQSGTNVKYCANAGTFIDEDIAFQLALGNLDPFTLKVLDNWQPSNEYEVSGGKTDNWKHPSIAKHRSIWQPDFRPYINSKPNIEQKIKNVKRKILNDNNFSPTSNSDSTYIDEEVNDEKLLSVYICSTDHHNKKIKLNESPPCASNGINVFENKPVTQYTNHSNDITILKCARNPFAKSITKTSPLKITINKVVKNISPIKTNVTYNNINLQKLSKFNRTILDNNHKVVSRFFKTSTIEEKTGIETTANNENTTEPNISELVSEIKLNYQKSINEAVSIYCCSPDGHLSPTQRNSPEKPDTKFECRSTTESISDNIIRCDNATVNENETLLKRPLIIEKKATPCRRPGLSKNKPKQDSTQSRLSMFGFKKKSSLK